jgi:hypothetical protein
MIDIRRLQTALKMASAQQSKNPFRLTAAFKYELT